MQPIDLPSTPADSRDYSLFRHDSGLHCLLISDPAASQATAVLQVDAGSHDEPLERPGLAHLLEHLLFMGSEAHPEPEVSPVPSTTGVGATMPALGRIALRSSSVLSRPGCSLACCNWQICSPDRCSIRGW